jgi:hypothetical protein
LFCVSVVRSGMLLFHSYMLSFSHSSVIYSFACATLYASFPALMFLSVYRAYCLYLSVSLLGKFS